MNWAQATFVVDAEQVDPVTAMLEMFLAQAVTSENAGKDEYYEVAFPGNPSWQKVKLTALFEDSIDLTPIIGFVQEQLTNTANGEVTVTISKLVDQDWERVWLSSFKPLEVGTNLWICPSWCEPVDPDARNIILDPAQRNDLENSVFACLPKNLSEKPQHRYDVVIANILAEVIIELSDTLLLHLKADGVMLLTGILSAQAERVIDVFGNDFDYTLHHQEQWCLIEVTKKIPTNDETA